MEKFAEKKDYGVVQWLDPDEHRAISSVCCMDVIEQQVTATETPIIVIFLQEGCQDKQQRHASHGKEGNSTLVPEQSATNRPPVARRRRSASLTSRKRRDHGEALGVLPTGDETISTA